MTDKVLYQMATILILLLFLTERALCFGNVSSPHTFCVCEQNCKNCNYKDCTQLENYVEKLVPNNSILRFCGGSHTLSRPWKISGVKDIVLHRDSEGEAEIIQCSSSGNAGILFSNVSGLRLSGIGMHSCGVDTKDNGNYTINAALVFRGGEDLLLQSITALRSPVAGIAISNVGGHVRIEGSLFANASISSKNEHYLKGNFIEYNRFSGENVTIEIQDTKFENNVYIMNQACNISDLRLSAGLSIIIRHGGVAMSFSHVSFVGNGGCAGGNMAIFLFDFYKLVDSTSIVVGHDSTIERGNSNVGGGIFVTLVNSNDNSSDSAHIISEGYARPFLKIQDSTFRNNAAYYVGGAIYLKHMEAYHFSTPGTVEITNCTFAGNQLLNGTADGGGWALHFTTFVVREYKFHERPQMKVIVSQCTFTKHGGVESRKLGNAVVFVKTNPYFNISDTNITDNNCTGILAISSNIVASNSVIVSGNVAFSGGGLLLCAGAVLYLSNRTHMVISNNTASHTGGGIHIESECIINRPRCFFQFDSDADSLPIITVKDNSAGYAGDNLYGGSVDDCYMINLKKPSLPIFRKIFEVPRNGFSKKSYSMVSSPPRRVCLVEGSKCLEHKKLSIYPGESILVKAVVVVGQLNGSVPGTVYVNIVDPELKDTILFIPKKDAVQAIPQRDPQPIRYRIYSMKEGITADVSLTAKQLGSGSNPPLVLSVKIKPCLLGFTLRNKSSQSSCSCAEVRKYIDNIKCYISRKVGIEYHPPAWIGMVQTGSTKVIAVSKSCPQDYCSVDSKLFLDLKKLKLNSTMQCSFHRVGVLCGSCLDGYSLLLGSSKCSQGCSNYYLLLLPVFAVAGIALVFFITFLNLTVTEATLNGLIFYANVIQIYSFFMFEKTDMFVAQFLRVFIAWINLDFGIESCFFVGMDSFSKTLLQFAFPVYIWMIAVAIILLSRKYDTIARICGRDSVKVLATLVLLSYSKILQAVTNALHFTTVHYVFKDGHSQRSMHWTSGGHLRYLEGKHLVVFLIGAVFAAGVLPFMFTLICIQKIGLVSNWPCFGWVHRLKPFFDSITGPFTDRGRFWVGFLLFIRILVMGVYSFKLSSSNGTVMATTVLICLILLSIGAVLPRGIYKKPILNVLESFFIANLGLLYLGLFCSMHYDSKLIKKCSVFMSVGAAFVVFLFVLARHISMKMKCSRILKRFMQRIGNREWHTSINTTDVEVNPHHHTSLRRQTLHRFGSCDEEREPLLSTMDY